MNIHNVENTCAGANMQSYVNSQCHLETFQALSTNFGFKIQSCKKEHRSVCWPQKCEPTIDLWWRGPRWGVLLNIDLYRPACIYVRLTTGRVPPNRPVPITGLILTTWPKIICRSHKWVDFTLTVLMMWLVSFLEWCQSQIKKTTYLPQATTILPHAGNQLCAVAVAGEDPYAIYYLKDINVSYYDQSDTVHIFQENILISKWKRSNPIL